MAGQIIKRGDRTWLIRIYLGRDANGKRRYHNKTVHGTKKEADKIKRDLLTRQDNGENLERPKGSVDEYLDAWLETTAAPSVRSRTLHDYTNTLKRYVRPYIGPCRWPRSIRTKSGECWPSSRRRGFLPARFGRLMRLSGTLWLRRKPMGFSRTAPPVAGW